MTGHGSPLTTITLAHGCADCRGVLELTRMQSGALRYRTLHDPTCPSPDRKSQHA